MSKTILFVPDIHCTPGVDNERADYLAKLTNELQPDIVINIGDQWDFSSLSSYDKGRRSFQGRSYKADLDVGLEFSERWWDPVKARKKKLPRRIFFVGNHEERIERALDLSPELEGTIGYKDLELDRYYDEVVDYVGGTPGILNVEGILVAHYFISGLMGRPIGGKWPARMVLEANKQSSIQGHTHTLDYATTITQGGKEIHSLVGGCYHDHVPGWAGNIGKFWRPGVSILRNTEDGAFDYQFVSMKSLKKEYGNG